MSYKGIFYGNTFALPLCRSLGNLNDQTEKQIRTAEERLRSMQYLDSKSAEYQETLQSLRVLRNF
jgi:hypothetical protein